jgi:hypothetical protein
MNEAIFNEERFIEQYKVLLEQQLRFNTISNKKIFQSVHITKGTITSNPLAVELLLRKQVLPPFQFINCKN